MPIEMVLIIVRTGVTIEMVLIIVRTGMPIEMVLIIVRTGTVKLLNKGHPFCRAFVATIEGWPLLRGFI